MTSVPQAVHDQLRGHVLLRDVPVAEFEWLLEHGQPRSWREGEVPLRAGAEAEGLYVVLTGHLAVHLERPYGRRLVMEWRGGDVTGSLPYSRMRTSPGDVRVVADTEALMVPRDLVGRLPAVCPTFTERLVHAMIDRARRFTSSDLHDQRTLALGKIAAGLAHELNNPAAALVRSAKALLAQVAAAGAVASQQRARPADPDDDVPAAVAALFEASRLRPPPEWDALERADREQAVQDVLGTAGRASDDPEIAAVVAGSAMELDELVGLVRSGGADAAAAVRAAARATALELLASEVVDGAGRVYALVSTLKRFSHMDATMTAESVDVSVGIRDAVTLLAEKARQGSVGVVLELAQQHPSVIGVVEELNQVWLGLLDNAVDAATPGGNVRITSAGDAGRVRVEVRDDGPGIPDAIRDRIFDPFFTTKPPGSGAGLGLALVRRVIDDHHGEITVTSRPGETVFRVELDGAAIGRDPG